jgi:hypothetical protein
MDGTEQARRLRRVRPSGLAASEYRTLLGLRHHVAPTPFFRWGQLRGSRRTRTVIGLSACFFLSGGLAYPASVNTMVQPGVTAAAGLMAMLAGRSPGERLEGTVTSKPRQARVAAAVGARPGMDAGEESEATSPTARLLPALGPIIGEAPEGALPVMDLGQGVAPLTAALAGAGTEDLAAAVGTPGAAGLVFPLLAPGGGPGGFGAAPGGENPVSPPGGGPVVVTPVSPVPEPSTWITMLLGFAAVGLGLRRRRAASEANASQGLILREASFADRGTHFLSRHG